MALRDLSLPDLLDLAQSGIDRMRADDHLEQLMGLSFLRQLIPHIQAQVITKEKPMVKNWKAIRLYQAMFPSRYVSDVFVALDGTATVFFTDGGEVQVSARTSSDAGGTE